MRPNRVPGREGENAAGRRAGRDGRGPVAVCRAAVRAAVGSITAGPVASTCTVHYIMFTEQTNEFIDAVRSHPYLYQLDHELYKDSELKIQTWRDIATQLRMGTGHDAKMKWRNLKDCYMKYKKYKKMPNGQAYKKYKKWRWAKHMQFMDETCQPSETDESVLPKASEVVKVEIEMEPTEMSPPATSFTGSFRPEKPRNLQETGVSVAKRKKVDSDVNAIIEYFDKKRQKTQGVDHINQLFLNYANTFKQLSRRTQISLKLKMAQIFAAAETEDLMLSQTPFANNIIDSPTTQHIMTLSSQNPNVWTLPSQNSNAETLQTQNGRTWMVSTQSVHASAPTTLNTNTETLATQNENSGTHPVPDANLETLPPQEDNAESSPV